MSKRIMAITKENMPLVKMGHDVIFERNEQLFNILVENTKNPVTVQQLMEMVDNARRNEIKSES